MRHRWIKSTLGHGNAMCAHCSITDLEARAIGQMECLAAEAGMMREALPPGPFGQIIDLQAERAKRNG